MKFMLSVPSGYESPWLGSPYVFKEDSVISITIKMVKIFDEGSNIAFVNYDLSIDTDGSISFNRTNDFDANNTDDLYEQAKSFLTKFYSG